MGLPDVALLEQGAQQDARMQCSMHVQEIGDRRPCSFGWERLVAVSLCPASLWPSVGSDQAGAQVLASQLGEAMRPMSEAFRDLGRSRSALGEDRDNLTHRMAMTSLLASGPTGVQARHAALGGAFATA